MSGELGWGEAGALSWAAETGLTAHPKMLGTPPRPLQLRGETPREGMGGPDHRALAASLLIPGLDLPPPKSPCLVDPRSLWTLKPPSL